MIKIGAAAGPARPLPVLLTAAALSATATAAAEESGPGAEARPLETVVVVGEADNTVVTPEMLESYQANDLADVFRHVPSVEVGGSLGIAQKIYIRGLEDTLLNVTVDGARQTSTLFHHIGRVSIEPELLQQVQVQVGAGEATSGAGAIGGAIRFRTRDPADFLDAGQRVGGLIKTGYFSNEGYKVSGTGFAELSERWGLLGSYVYTDRENMEDGDGNELPGTAAEQRLGYLKLHGTLSDDQTLIVSYEQRDEEGEFGARPNWPALEGDTLYPLDGTRQTGVVNYRFQGNDLINLDGTVYYTESEIVQNRFDTWGRYQGAVTTWGFDLRNTSFVGPHTLTYGVDYQNDEAEGRYLADPSRWQDWAWDPAIGEAREEGEILGVYAQDHWQLGDRLLLSFGVRYDEYDLEQVTYGGEAGSDGFSPNVGLAFDVTDTLQFTAGYAEAMRGKEVGDAFTLEHAPGSISLDPGLEPETVENTEVALEYDDGRLMGSVAFYWTTIDDVIMDQLGAGVFYENVGRLESDGYELMLGYLWERVSLTASYVENDAELNGDVVEGYEHNGLANQRGDTFNVDLTWRIFDGLEAGAHYTHVQDLDNLEVLQRAVALGWIDATRTIDKPGYDVVDVFLRWSPLATDSLSVDFAVLNLFDEHYRDHSSVGDYNDIPGWGGVAGLYEAGRDVRLTVAFEF